MDSKLPSTEARYWTRRLTVSFALLLPLMLLSYRAWRSLFEAVLISNESIFVWPLLWFSALAVVFALESVLADTWWLRVLASFSTFAPSLVFARTGGHALFLLVACGLSLLVMPLVLRERRERVHLNIQKSIMAGFSFFILALSLAVSSQYYAHAQKLSWENLVTSFDLGEGNMALVLRLASTAYPPLRQLQDGEVTVDGFLKTFRPNTVPMEEFTPELVSLLSAQGVTVDPLLLDRSVEGAILQKQRSSLSRLVGRDVGGEEKMHDILSEALRKKMRALLSGTAERSRLPVPILPLFLSVLLFLTVYPLAALLAPLYAALAALLFLVCRKLRLVVVSQVPVEQEQIQS